MVKTKLIFDGGFIMIPSEQFQEGVEWYRKHMGWELIDTVLTPIGAKAFFKLPGGGQANLKSFELDHEHFTPEEYNEGHSRFCFSTDSLEKAKDYFSEHEIPFSETFTLPDGQMAIDIKAYANVRLTLCQELESNDTYPESRVATYSKTPIWYGVRNLQEATAWYTEHLGLTVAQTDYTNKGFVLLGDKDGHHIWLQQLSANDPMPKANPGARAYFFIENRNEFIESQKSLRTQGIYASEPVGERWMGYHFYDPDGNRINVWNFY
ncbi:VOC family protein [Bacillus alkalicellulosilyticus]|uniref:VOC family protein n=1 Tax=Alkalihalobacterium alkalicellulosilyticum TaxID=1912214 RepID=UPI000997A7D4|nr:VOC family protein [Bacillus alkalicellulosilyticus]